MTSETDIQNAIRLALSRGPCRLFRQQVGEYWTGDAVHLKDGSVLIRHPRRVHVGFSGWSDLGGWLTETVNDQPFARYVAIEVKTPRGRFRDGQEAFLDTVAKAGGLAGVARSVADAEKILKGA